jgi:hypothetical protein
LNVPGYDGEQYYEIARSMPLLFNHAKWEELTTPTTIAYSYQRFLLPLGAFVLSLGHEAALPYTFLAIELASLLGACIVMLTFTPKRPLYALALALSPPALIGLHFSLAEPLALFLLAAFLMRFELRSRLRTIDIILLSLFALTREINVVFIGLLLLYLISQKRWQDAFLMIVPLATFFALHTLIYAIFAHVPFFVSTGKRTLPFGAVLPLLMGERGYNVYTLSAIALFLMFVLPALIWTATVAYRDRMHREFLPLASLAFLLIMTVMAPDIWGSITSIGRVITPVYPVFLILAAKHDTLPARLIAAGILILGLASGVGLALMSHPFTLS